MSVDKFQLFLVYGLACLWVAFFIPFVVWRRRTTGEQVFSSVGALISSDRFGLVAGLIALLTIFAFLSGWSWRHLLYGAAASLLIPSVASRFGLASACWSAIAVLLATLLPWWLRADVGRLNLSGTTWTVVLSVTVLLSWLMCRRSDGGFSQRPVFKWLGVVSVVAIAVAWTFSTGMSLTHANTTPWHHWGAYVGPAETVMAGAVPFRDIPLQYGLGPTVLLMLGGPAGAWSMMYWAAGVMTVAMIVMLCMTARSLLEPRASASEVCVVMLAMLVCGLIWTAYPAEVMATLATPSTTGLRFFPGTLFLFLLIQREQRLMRNNCPDREAPVWGHVVWLSCLLWSPEAALHATALWVPYVMWSSDPRGGWRSLLKAMLDRSLTLALVLAMGVVGFVALFWLKWQEFPLFAEYVAYIKHPPGPLPVNRQGAIWFAFGAFVVFVFASLGSFQSAESVRGRPWRQAWLVALLALAVFPYYMGRSHDNNILNLLSFIALLLLAARAIADAAWIRRFCEVAFAFLLSWMVVFGPQNIKQTWSADRLFSFEPAALFASFDRGDEKSLFYLRPQSSSVGINPEDLVQALHSIRAEHNEAIETLDLFMLVDQGEAIAPWNALHGPENFVYFPAHVRQRYLSNGAKRLKRGGWLVHGPGPNVNDMLADYDAVYLRTEERQFGTYRAIRYVPR